MPVLTRAVWKSMNHFIEFYDLKKTRAYEMVKEEGFPMKRIGKRGIRVDMSKVDAFMDKYN